MSQQRFRGVAASKRSVHAAAALITLAVLVAGAVGLAFALPAAFFAVGAGAGYSLSGSV